MGKELLTTPSREVEFIPPLHDFQAFPSRMMIYCTKCGAVKGASRGSKGTTCPAYVIHALNFITSKKGE